jgi:hypothetical protein
MPDETPTSEAASSLTFSAPESTNESLLELVMKDKSLSGDMNDWDHLDTESQDNRAVDDEGFRLYDDDGNRIDQMGNIIEDETDDDTDVKPDEKKVETEPEPKAEETEAKKPEADPKVLEQWEFFQKSLVENPDAVAAAIVNEMDPRQRASFLNKLGISQDAEGIEREAFDVEQYEPQSDLEIAVANRWQDLESIPHIVRDTQELKNQMTSSFQTIAPAVDHANIASLVAMAQLEVMATAMGIQFPSIDFQSMATELADGRKTYKSVVDKYTAPYKTVAENAKQRSAPRPQTPANQSRQPVEKLSSNASMADIIRSIPGGREFLRGKR